MMCTSTICTSEPGTNEHCQQCSHALYQGHGHDTNGRLWRWEFAPQYGTVFLRKDGEPLVYQPGENSTAWKPFGEWFSDVYKEIER